MRESSTFVVTPLATEISWSTSTTSIADGSLPLPVVAINCAAAASSTARSASLPASPALDWVGFVSAEDDVALPDLVEGEARTTSRVATAASSARQAAMSKESKRACATLKAVLKDWTCFGVRTAASRLLHKGKGAVVRLLACARLLTTVMHASTLCAAAFVVARYPTNQAIIPNKHVQLVHQLVLVRYERHTQ